jgi:hypothetical protein
MLAIVEMSKCGAKPLFKTSVPESFQSIDSARKIERAAWSWVWRYG